VSPRSIDRAAMRPGILIVILYAAYVLPTSSIGLRAETTSGDPSPISPALHLLSVTILEAGSGDTLAARCSVMKRIGGKWYPSWPSDPEAYYHTAEGGYFYTTGTFTVNVPAGTTRIQIGHGPEYAPLDTALVLTGDSTVSFELVRIIDMRDYGWHSGDCHVHIAHSGGVFQLDPGDAHYLGRAEGLGVVNCLDNSYCFSGGPDPVSTPDCIVYMTEEYRSGTYGHLGLLGLEQIFTPDWSQWWPTTLDVACAIHLQPGAAVIAAHPVCTEDFQSLGSWPGNGLARELPVDVAGGVIDAFEVMSYSNCHPGHIELDMWYRFLNCGFKLPAAAGTDAGMNRSFDRPLGGFRTYVHVPDEPCTFDGWLAGLKMGRTFVTNGPLITRFDFQGWMPGDSLRLPAGFYRIYGWLSVRGNYPLSRAEIIQNGEVVKSIEVGDGRTHLDESFILPIDRSCWVAARVSGVDSTWHVIGDTLFAHTSPVYFKLDRKRVVVKEDAEYFANWIGDLEELAHEQREWPSPFDSNRVFSLFAGAHEFYAGLASTGVGVSPRDQRSSVSRLVLRQNRPNPFSTGTFIEFELPEPGGTVAQSSAGPGTDRSGPVELAVYDVRGSLVRRLFRGELPPGRHALAWDGRDDRGHPVAVGVYLYRIRAGGQSAGRKMLLIR
jgi:hypothetical protein